jgi:hypothetical protein
VEVLKSPIDAVKRKRGESWRDRTLILYYDNSPAYFSLRVPQFLAGKGISARDHLSHSPDLAPAELWLFSEYKECAERKAFLGH